MSTALIRDIRSALFDFGRPVPEDVTLTTGVRELIAAVSESEDDLERVRADLNTALADKAAAVAEWHRTIGERDGARRALATVGDALGIAGIVNIPAPYDLAKAVLDYQDWITARTGIACVVSAIAGAGLAWSVVLL